MFTDISTVQTQPPLHRKEEAGELMFQEVSFCPKSQMFSPHSETTEQKLRNPHSSCGGKDGAGTHLFLCRSNLVRGGERKEVLQMEGATPAAEIQHVALTQRHRAEPTY